ncbi:unnamed protein product [Cylindrotheca closterium]|uniref:Transmembrane protein n=1 Tax=Cylindrotheca closterium TaxID=2856 RepID=A0AAD2CVL2_9STRA|nr:unnamed protein product [Cylindrotheca closterium]
MASPTMSSDSFMLSTHRELTFIGDDDFYKKDTEVYQVEQIVGFGVIALAFFVTCYLTNRLSRETRELYEWNAIRLILPAAMFFMGLESMTLAMDYAHINIWRQWAVAIYMFESMCAPGIFMATFVATFLSYRTRSIPFCMVYRGPGRSTNSRSTTPDDEDRQTLIRPATMVVMMRVFTVAILMLSFGVNFDVVWDKPDLAGRTGWMTILTEPWQEDSSAHVVYSLLPMGMTSLSCLYFSALLWRYGSEFSMIVYPSSINPWIYTLVGSIIMFIGQFPGPDWFPLASNAGILVYLVTMLRLLHEVRKDILQAGDLGEFLHALGSENASNMVSEPASTNKEDPESPSTPYQIT